MLEVTRFDREPHRRVRVSLPAAITRVAKARLELAGLPSGRKSKEAARSPPTEVAGKTRSAEADQKASPQPVHPQSRPSGNLP